jgi:cell filamentation protein
MDALFKRLKEQKFLCGLETSAFAATSAHFLSELNAIHPFREGNGRTQMVFFGILAVQAGHPLDLEQLKPETFLAAMIEAFNGNEAPLAAQIRRLL